MNPYVIADLHLGHDKILIFSPSRGGPTVKTVEQHDQWIIKQWNSVVTKQDVTIVLGDVAFSKDALAKVKLLNGTKHLVFGNHDKFSIAEYLKYFSKIHGFYKKQARKGVKVWLSHPPIHPHSLRDLVNIHGHTHANCVVGDKRYVCVSVEHSDGVPRKLEDIV